MRQNILSREEYQKMQNSTPNHRMFILVPSIYTFVCRRGAITLALLFVMGMSFGQAPVIKEVTPAQGFGGQTINIKGGGEDKGSDKLKKYYVVVKSFKDFESADALVRTMNERELYTNVFYNKADGQYHVYSFQTFKLKEANEQKRAVEEITGYKSVTIITVEQ